MKQTWKDIATIILAFAAVFMCGYGIGHMVGERQAPPRSSTTPGDGDTKWEEETLRSLKETLKLRPEQIDIVESQLSRTAKAIRDSRDEVVLEYHQHIAKLYDNLIEVLDPDQASQLRGELKSLDKRIKMLSDTQPR